MCRVCVCKATLCDCSASFPRWINSEKVDNEELCEKLFISPAAGGGRLVIFDLKRSNCEKEEEEEENMCRA
jgi:hypothetical protein